MAQRLIDADAFRREIDTYPPFDKETQDSNAMANLAKESLLVALNNTPTIDAEPVRHGKWITCTSSEHWKCSECGCRAGYWFNEENSGIDSWEMDFSECMSDYCPQCGARMDEE